MIADNLPLPLVHGQDVRDGVVRRLEAQIGAEPLSPPTGVDAEPYEVGAAGQERRRDRAAEGAPEPPRARPRTDRDVDQLTHRAWPGGSLRPDGVQEPAR